MKRAELEDIPNLLRMARAFHAAADLEVHFDEETFRNLCARLIGGDLSLVLVDSHAMLVVLCFPAYYNANALVAQELFWWVDPEARGKGVARALLEAAESWAREKGAQTLQMVSLDALDGAAIGEMYERRGYKPLERSYQRRL